MTDLTELSTWNDLNRNGQKGGSVSEVFGGIAATIFAWLAWTAVGALLLLGTTGCSSMGEISNEIEQVADAGQSIEYVIDQAGDSFGQTKELFVRAANAAEASQASFGGETACFTPALEAGRSFWMTFQIPGRILKIKQQNGNTRKARSLKLQSFETENAYFSVARFASFMRSDLLVKVYKGNKRVGMKYTPIREVYSKEDLKDKSCEVHLVRYDQNTGRIRVASRY